MVTFVRKKPYLQKLVTKIHPHKKLVTGGSPISSDIVARFVLFMSAASPSTVEVTLSCFPALSNHPQIARTPAIAGVSWS